MSINRKFNIKSVFKTYILVLILIIAICIYIYNSKLIIAIDGYVIVTFIFNGVIILCGIISDKKKYSLNKIFWYFSLFFFFLAPLCQYLSGFSAWNYELKSEDYLKANVALLVWNIIYLIGYTQMKKKKKNTNKKDDKLLLISNRITYSLVIFELFTFIVAIKLIGFSNMFTREYNVIELGTGFVNTIVINFIRTVPVYTLVYCYWSYKEKKSGKFPIIMSFILTVCLNYPASVTRYWVGAVYIGIAIIFFNNFIKGKTFDYGLIFIFAIVFPIFQLFKWYGIVDIISGAATKDLINVYNNVDFDAYSMLARSFIFVKDNSIMYGRQLLSTLLFFIPRMIWNNKALPTGELIAETQGQFFTNLSCPLIGEAYVNFGFAGIIIYSLVFSIILRKLDDLYWNRNTKRYQYVDYTYPFSLGLLIFLLRGSFHPAIVYIFTFYLYIILYRIIDCFILKNFRYRKER